ncbi:hypothetical protein HYV88_01505 [Candidatus Woesearchaeota archaeon]|nr:hypothetical protein [Candidatus Woesearchaeota archaeon]
MNSLLLTRPDHDDTTHYLYHWSIEFIELAQKKNIRVFDLKGEKATRKQVEGHLSKKEPNLVIFNGHGDVNIIAGYKDEPLIILGENDSYLNSKIVYSRSCKSAKGLGRNSNAKAYIGYKEDFIFFYEPDKLSRPLIDKTAQLFLEPTNKFVTSLIKGNSIAESQDKSSQEYQNNIQRLLVNDINKEDTHMAKYLWWNWKSQTITGDTDARIET